MKTMNGMEIKIDDHPECDLCGVSFDTLKKLTCHLRDEHYLKRLSMNPEETLNLDKKIILNVLRNYLFHSFHNKHRIPFSQSSINEIAEVLNKALSVLGSVQFGIIFSDYLLKKPKFTALPFDENDEIIIPFYISCRDFEYLISFEIELIVHIGRYWDKKFQR